MSPQEDSAADILLDYVQNVRRVSAKVAELASRQKEHTLFLKEIAERIGHARRSMFFGHRNQR